MKTNPIARLRARIMTAAFALAAALPGAGHAAGDFPTRPISLIVPFSPGGGTDISARLLAAALGQQMNASVVVDNRPGAGGQIAADLVARAAPTAHAAVRQFRHAGHQSLAVQAAQRSGQGLRAGVAVFRPAFRPGRAHHPAGQVCRRTCRDGQVAARRAHLRQFGHRGRAPPGGGDIPASHGRAVDPRALQGGGPAMTDLMAGRVDMLFASVLETVTYVNAGKLRALAVTGPARSPVMPEVPTLDEAGVPNAQTGSWTAVLEPAGTPQAIVDKLSLAIRQVAGLPDVKEKLISQGAVPHGSTPQALAELAARERARYGDIIKQRNLHVDLADMRMAPTLRSLPMQTDASDAAKNPSQPPWRTTRLYPRAGTAGASRAELLMVGPLLPELMARIEGDVSRAPLVGDRRSRWLPGAAWGGHTRHRRPAGATAPRAK